MTIIERRRIGFVVAALAFGGIGLHLAAPTLNGLKWSGLLGGYWLAAQGGPLLLLALLVWRPFRTRNADQS